MSDTLAAPLKTSEKISGTSALTPRRLAAGILAVVAVVILVTFRDYGISWDEWLQNTYGEKLLEFYRTGFSDTTVFSFVNLYLYGGFFDLTAAILNLASPFGVYDTRHLLGAVIYLGGLVAGWKLARLMAGERAALIALACLATTPLLYGHGFINPKDSPLAWFGLWTTYFCCRVLESGERLPWKVAIGFGVSLGLTIGTRVIGIAYIGYLFGVLAVASFAHMRAHAPVRKSKDALLRLATGIGIALVLMAVFWPWSVQKPSNIFAALSTFEHFPFKPLVLWNHEQVVADHLPDIYLPGLLLMQLPEYILVGLVAALAAGIYALRTGIIAVFTGARAQQYLYVTGCALAPLAGYIVVNPTIYNGLRHFLFIVPPLVILGAIGLDKLLGFALRRNRMAGLAVAALLALAIARQTVNLVRLHPYEYLSYNSLVGGIAGAANRFELDYWGTTLAESARGLGEFLAKEPGSRSYKVFGCGDRRSSTEFLPPGTELTEIMSEADFYLAMTGVRCQAPPRPGQVIFEVKRMGVQLGYVLDLRTP